MTCDSSVHHMRAETRQATCCDNPGHRWWWGVCSCGWEQGFGTEQPDFTGHRLTVLEEAAGVKVKFG